MQSKALREKKIKVDCESVGPLRMDLCNVARHRGVISVVVEANSIWSRILFLSTPYSLSLSVSRSLCKFWWNCRCTTLDRAERGLRSFMKMDIFLPEVGSHPDLVISGGRSCHQLPVLVNLISSTSSASLRTRVRCEETRMRSEFLKSLPLFFTDNDNFIARAATQLYRINGHNFRRRYNPISDHTTDIYWHTTSQRLIIVISMIMYYRHYYIVLLNKHKQSVSNLKPIFKINAWRSLVSFKD